MIVFSLNLDYYSFFLYIYSVQDPKSSIWLLDIVFVLLNWSPSTYLKHPVTCFMASICAVHCFGPFAGLKIGGIWHFEIIFHVDKSILTVTHLCMSRLHAVVIKKLEHCLYDSAFISLHFHFTYTNKDSLLLNCCKYDYKLQTDLPLLCFSEAFVFNLLSVCVCFSIPLFAHYLSCHFPGLHLLALDLLMFKMELGLELVCSSSSTLPRIFPSSNFFFFPLVLLQYILVSSGHYLSLWVWNWVCLECLNYSSLILRLQI